MTATAELTEGRDLDVRVHDAALRHVVANLAPLQVLLLPLTLATALLMQENADPTRLGVWVVLALAASLVVIGACNWFVSPRPVDHRAAWLAASALFAVGAVAGMSTWVAATANTEVMVVFAMFPTVSCTVGTVVCAGRRDMFAVYVTPLVVLSGWGLWSTGEELMRSLALMVVVFCVSQALLHHTLSISLWGMLRHQIDSETVATRMADDRRELSAAYSKLSESNAQLAHMASHDPLTGLLNRRGTIDRLDGALARADGGPVGLLYLDLDRFKAINDLLGHRGGDHFLGILADRITSTIDQASFAGRIGGDEFVVVVPGAGADQAHDVGLRLVQGLAQPVHAEGRSVPSSVSIGVAVAPEQGRTSSDLLRNANAALYRAKHAGRNRVELFDAEMQVELQALLDAELALRRALDNGEIMPFFQPELDAVTGAVVGAELLARWLRPDGQVVSATDFIGLARRAGLLERLTERVLHQARPDIRRFIQLGLPADFRFRINLGPASTDRSWRNSPLEELLNGIDPRLVTVDVRESAVTGDLSTAAATLASFRAADGRVCLDDFVRGVSSLSLLRRLPIDEVRIDREAIDSITAHPHDRAIVRSIIAVVREIGLAVSAEGVETGAQADTLIALGCVRHQGHLYAPALPAREFETFLIERHAATLAAAEQPPIEWATRDLD